MPTTEKLRKKLKAKLAELFQLDQPDLDFGFYRIMRAKSQQVKSFIEQDLLQIIEDALGEDDEVKRAVLRKIIEKEIEVAKSYGALEPEKSPKVLDAKDKYKALSDRATAESGVYDHLYRFFGRYYDNGDFISLRYYTRENAGKAAPYAIPYNGEEVKLHWANADQYYIKTTEYFSNYSFDITQATEIHKLSNDEKALNGISEKPLKVHFRVKDASEGEHGNVKAAEDKKRFFIMYKENPIEFNEADELVINFEYKALPGGKNDVDADTEKALKEKFGKSLNKRDMPNLAITDKLIETATRSDKARRYLGALSLKAPTEKIPNRPLLAKYINQYTARNTCDYFIHKDLSGFLKRELDFYIKNEVMHLDDIENADAPAVENYLNRIKVIRKIATKLIEFLAQLEDFQKKLWLKKKFVTETNYCITLDRVPEELYPEIATNDAQREEWIKLFAIDELKTDVEKLPNMRKPAYSVPLTTDFLKANNKLVLDTVFFSEEFKAKLIASIEDFDERCDGLLIHSENFQALNLLQERFREQVKCVYIDPPYNTEADRFQGKFIYKDGFDYSSWLSFISGRLGKSKCLLIEDGGFFVSIGINEIARLKVLLDNFWGDNLLVNATWISGRTAASHFTSSQEYILGYSKNKDIMPLFSYNGEESVISDRAIKRPGVKNPASTIIFPAGMDFESEDKVFPNSFGDKEPVEITEGIFEACNCKLAQQVTIKAGWTMKDMIVKWLEGEEVIDSKGQKIKRFFFKSNGTLHYEKERGTIHPSSIINNITTKQGTNELEGMLGQVNAFDFPKPSKLISYFVGPCGRENGIVLDYFAGSGTTGHAVINLNREDGGKRKYILVEMGDYFDTVLKPRIAKVIYSSDWKDGKPTSRKTSVSHCFKYIRLESYEDTLNNLRFSEGAKDEWIKNCAEGRRAEFGRNRSLREDYMLHYLLEVETRGSQSLLNIDDFTDPWAHTLRVKKPGSDETIKQHVDLVETFNYLIGLRVVRIGAPEWFDADFTRKPDAELPEERHTKLVVSGEIRQVKFPTKAAAKGLWKFRRIEGWVPADPLNPNNGQKERVLIIWRTLPAYAQLRDDEKFISEQGLEGDNLMLDEWFKRFRTSTRDFNYDTIYVNGSNNLLNLKNDDESWGVRLIEEEFHKKMWEME